MSKLVLAEKPSVAQSIARVLGADRRFDGYLEGNGYIVSWWSSGRLRPTMKAMRSGSLMICRSFPGNGSIRYPLPQRNSTESFGN